MRSLWMSLAVLGVGASPALGQDHPHRPASSAAPERGAIASLSPQEHRDLLAGAGMGLARAAELNGYPGPLHVLELADSLGLTTEQRARIAAIRQAVLARAVALGERIVEAERALSLRFEHGHVDSTALARATGELGRLAGELRYEHLAAHLATRPVLTADQVAAYDRLRGHRREP